MFKKRIINIICICILGVTGFGIYSLANTIVNKGYSSLVTLEQEKLEDLEDNRVVEIKDDGENIKEGAVRKYKYNPGEIQDDDGNKIYLERVRDILFDRNSPYNNMSSNFTIEELDLSNGEKKFVVTDKGKEVITMYGNNVDYSVYMFTKSVEFGSKENEYFNNLANGTTGYNKETNEYYWVYK